MTERIPTIDFGRFPPAPERAMSSRVVITPSDPQHPIVRATFWREVYRCTLGIPELDPMVEADKALRLYAERFPMPTEVPDGTARG